MNSRVPFFRRRTLWGIVNQPNRYRTCTEGQQRIKVFQGTNFDVHDKSLRKGKLARFAELGPGRISAITGFLAVLFAAGFFVGHTTGSPRAQPAVTITGTPSSGKSAVPSSSEPSTGTVASSAGKLLGSYTVTLPRMAPPPLGQPRRRKRRSLRVPGTT